MKEHERRAWAAFSLCLLPVALTSKDPAMSSEIEVLYVPTRPYAAWAGLSSGPSILTAVRTLVVRQGR